MLDSKLEPRTRSRTRSLMQSADFFSFPVGPERNNNKRGRDEREGERERERERERVRVSGVKMIMYAARCERARERDEVVRARARVGQGSIHSSSVCVRLSVHCVQRCQKSLKLGCVIRARRWPEGPDAELTQPRTRHFRHLRGRRRGGALFHSVPARPSVPCCQEKKLLQGRRRRM